jgi:hypothetical protein
VSSVAYSPDGKRIVSGSGDKTLKVWDAQTGQEVLSLKGHTFNVTSVAFSPDAKRIVSGSWDQTLKLWDALTGQQILSLMGHTDSVTSVAYSPDGQRISGKDHSGKMLTWDAVTGQLLPDAPAVPTQQQTEATSPDGAQRAFIEDGQIKVQRLLPEHVEARKRQQAQDRAFLERLARPDPAFHRQKADRYEKSGELFAAAFHLRCLLAIEPSDALRKRLAAVESRLAEQAKVPAPMPGKPPAGKTQDR